MLDPFCAVDFETADDGRDSACAIGLARVEGGRVVYADAALICPPRRSEMFVAVHGLRWPDLKDQPPFPEVWKRFAPLLDGCKRLAAHNAPFDRGVLEACCRAAGIAPPTHPWVCTLKLSKARWPKPASNALPAVCERLGVVLERHHHAGADAEACARVLVALESLEAGDAADRRDGGGHPAGVAQFLPDVPGGPRRDASDGRQVGTRDDELRDPLRPHEALTPGFGLPWNPGVRRQPLDAAVQLRPADPHAARVRRLAAPAGPRWVAAAERLIADAEKGGWLPELAGWVADWAEKRAATMVGTDPCRGCGRPTENRVGFHCRACLAAEDGAGAAGRTPEARVA